MKIFNSIAVTIGLWMAGLATLSGQTLTSLYNFSSSIIATADKGTNGDGIGPSSDLLLSGNIFYGTSVNGGTNVSGQVGYGTVFAVNTDGTGFTNLHSFVLTVSGTNSSGGANPCGGVVLSGTTLFGATQYGGTSGSGAIFSVTTNGTLFNVLYDFTQTDPVAGTNTDGANPQGDLVLSGNTLYGVTYEGGTSNYGTVFALNTSTLGFTNLHNFTAGTNDGGYPVAGLILSGNTLYGTTTIGGSSTCGTVFALNTDGTGFALLHSFSALGPAPTTNSDGGFPCDRLLLAGGTLYGTAELGGSFGSGTVFSLSTNTNGASFTNLYSFSTLSPPVFGTNLDGAEPFGDLILASNILYGTTPSGGRSGEGAVFAISTNGLSFNPLYEFTTLSNVVPVGSSPFGNLGGASPLGALVLSSNALFGTTVWGGNWGNGAIFSISLVPKVSAFFSQTNFILQWPTNFTGFTLQSSSQLGAAASWSPVTPLPVSVNGQNTVTNPIIGAQMFYRLGQ
jgi:uncharacterized repeat protein (TIGR03803 family)